MTKPKKAVKVSSSMTIASTCGHLAGLPKSFADASRSLDDARRRCTEASATTGILTPAQGGSVLALSGEIGKLIARLNELQKQADALVASGIGVEKGGGLF